MDHIWQAPSRLKMLLALIFSEQLAKTFGPQFPKTLYFPVFISALTRKDQTSNTGHWKGDSGGPLFMKESDER